MRVWSTESDPTTTVCIFHASQPNVLTFRTYSCIALPLSTGHQVETPNHLLFAYATQFRVSFTYHIRTSTIIIRNMGEWVSEWVNERVMCNAVYVCSFFHSGKSWMNINNWGLCTSISMGLSNWFAGFEQLNDKLVEQFQIEECMETNCEDTKLSNFLQTFSAYF